MMSAPSPYPVITDTNTPLPDDAQINTVLPSICVDYLSHNWDKDEQIWASWKAMTKSKNEITNGVRLENASWRTWAKQRGNLKTISPETLNWLKDSDVTWLYGPLHEKANPVPPPKQATFADRYGLENMPPTTAEQRASRKSPLANSNTTAAVASPAVKRMEDPAMAPQTKSQFGPERRRGGGALAASSNRSSGGAPKSILKHRTIQDMLVLNIGRRAASPAIQTDSMSGGLFTPPTPGSSVSVVSAPSSGHSEQHVGNLGNPDSALYVRSDVNLPESSGCSTSSEVAIAAPSTPTEGATDYLAAVRLTTSSPYNSTAASDSASVSSASSTATTPALRPALVRLGDQDAGSAESIASSSRRSGIFEDRGKRPDRHISFNHRVEQCIVLEDATSDSTISFAEQARLQTPAGYGYSAAMVVPDASVAPQHSEPYLQMYDSDDAAGDDDYISEEEQEEESSWQGPAEPARVASESEGGAGLLQHANNSSRTVTTSHMIDSDDEHTEYGHRQPESHSLPSSGSATRMYTGSASSEEDLSTSSSSDGYDSDALTMRSSSAGSISESSSGHLSTREMMTRVGVGSNKAGRPKSRKGSLSSSSGVGGGGRSSQGGSASPPAGPPTMHTIAKLAPTLLKTSEAYPAPSPAVVDPTNFLQTLEHERERVSAERGPGGHGHGHGHGHGSHRALYLGVGARGHDAHGTYPTTTEAPWAESMMAPHHHHHHHAFYDPAYPSSTSAGHHSGGGVGHELYGRSVPVSIPGFGGRGEGLDGYGHDERGLYSVSASAAYERPPPDYAHFVCEEAGGGGAGSGSMGMAHHALYARHPYPHSSGGNHHPGGSQAHMVSHPGRYEDYDSQAGGGRPTTSTTTVAPAEEEGGGGGGGGGGHDYDFVDDDVDIDLDLHFDVDDDDVDIDLELDDDDDDEDDDGSDAEDGQEGGLGRRNAALSYRAFSRRYGGNGRRIYPPPTAPRAPGGGGRKHLAGHASTAAADEERMQTSVESLRPASSTSTSTSAASRR